MEVSRSKDVTELVAVASCTALLELLRPIHGAPAETAAILLRHLTPAVLGLSTAASGGAGEAIKTSAAAPSKAALDCRLRALQFAKDVLG